MNRGLLEIRQIHGNLRLATHQESCSFHKSQPTSREAHCLRDFLCNFNVRCVQKNVVCDKKFPCTNYTSTSSWVQARLSEIGLARRIGRNLLANPLKLSAANVFQVLPLGRRCSRFIQIDRNLVSPPDLFAHMTRHSYAIFNAHALDGNERDYVCSAQPGMR